MDIQTKAGKLTITAEGVVIGKSGTTVRALLQKPRVIKRDQIAGIQVHDGRRYLTGARMAGVVLTGGVALLAPRRREASVIIVVKEGEIINLHLTYAEAKRAEGISVLVRSLGYTPYITVAVSL